MSVYLVDTFNSSGGTTQTLHNHVSNLGSSWGAASQYWTVTPSGYCYHGSSASVDKAVWQGEIDPSFAGSYDVGLRFKILSVINNQGACLVVKTNTSGTTGELLRMYGGAGIYTLNIQEATSGYSVRASTSVSTSILNITGGVTYTLLGSISGNKFDYCLFNNSNKKWLNAGKTAFDQDNKVALLTYTGTQYNPLSPGYIGIQDYSLNTITTGVHLDSFYYGSYGSNAGIYSTALTLTGPSGGGNEIASTNFTVSSLDADISGSISITPQVTGGGTVSPSAFSLSGSQTGTFTYTPASTGLKYINITNDGGLTNPVSSLTYNVTGIAYATALTLTGPSSGYVNIPSSNFTVSPSGGNISGSLLIIPQITGGGSVSPSAFSLSGSQTGTFTYTPNTTGSKIIGITNNQDLINPPELTYLSQDFEYATLLTLTGPISGWVGNWSTDFTVSTDGGISGSSITVTPQVTGYGYFNPTFVELTSGSISSTFQFISISGGNFEIGVTNDGGLINPNHIIYFSDITDGLFLTGPTSGNNETPSTNFTVSMSAGGISGNINITLSDGGQSGTFSPSAITLNNGNISDTFTYTPSVSGNISISIDNDRGLINGGSPIAYYSAPYTVPETQQIIDLTDTRIIRSPQNWHTVTTGISSAIETVWPGTYIKYQWNGTGLLIGVDTSGLTTLPWVFYQVDSIDGTYNGTATNTLLTAGQTAITISGLSLNDYEITIIYAAKNNYGTTNTWADAQKLKINYLLPSGGTGTLNTLTAKPKTAILYGDSITEGLSISNPPALSTGSGSNSALGSYAHHLGHALNAEFDQAGIGGAGINDDGVGSFPSLINHWNLKKQGVSRDVSVYDYITCFHGYNDGASDIASSLITNWLTSVRAVNSTAWIFMMIPFSGRQRGSITTGVADYISANPSETKIKVIDLGKTYYKNTNSPYTTDNIHPTTYQGARLSSEMAGLIYGNILSSTTTVSGGEFSYCYLN